MRANAKLAIEIDGDVHASLAQTARDTARTAWLEERGYRVIRFDATDVGRNIAGVVDCNPGGVRGEGTQGPRALHSHHTQRAPRSGATGAVDSTTVRC